MAGGIIQHLRPLMLYLYGLMHQLYPLSAHWRRAAGCCSKESGLLTRLPSVAISRQLTSLMRMPFVTFLHWGREGYTVPLATRWSTWLRLLQSWDTTRMKVNLSLYALLSVQFAVDMQHPYRAASSPPLRCGYWQVSGVSHSVTNLLQTSEPSWHWAKHCSSWTSHQYSETLGTVFMLLMGIIQKY